MTNPFGTALLGRGRVPETLRRTLEHEGVLVLEERLRGSITFRDYHAAGRYSSWRRTGVRGALVVTRTRLAVYVRGSEPLVNVPFDNVRIARLDLTASRDGLTIGMDAHDFNPAPSGRIDVRLRCSDPSRVIAYVEAQRSALGT